IPCDVELLQHLHTDSAALWQNLVEHHDPEQLVYINGRFDLRAFARFVDAAGIDYPSTPAGLPDLKKLGDMAKSFPILKDIYTLYKLDSQLRSQKLQLNSDNRLIAELKPLATITGRHAPSSNSFVMGLAKPFRSLVTPEKGSVLFVLDYVAQEVGIAAVLSGEQALQRAYLHGDIYLTFAKQIGLVPDDATKQSHAAERDLCKTVFIAVLYGMGVSTLAQLLGCTHVDAAELLAGHRQNYPQLWLWQEAIIKQAREEHELRTASGWRVFVDHSTKPTTLKNWPIQAVGADILRKAVMDCDNAGLRVLAPLHDAIMFESSIEDHEVHIHQAQTLMVNAAKHWLSDFPLRLDTQLVFPGQTLCPTNVTGLKHFVGASLANLRGK
ncbi:DNA polymerase, partial [Alishewanella sp. SMS9]|nr:DNA polymerase [Alishewanella sp. SMS9]